MELENGRYRARAIDAMLGTADTGTKQVAVLFDLLDVPNTQIAWYGFFTEKTYKRTIESLIVAGWAGDNIADLMAQGLGSTEVSLVVENEQDQHGQWRPRVKWVNAPGAGVMVKNEMTDAEKIDFAKRLRGQVLAVRKELGQKAFAPSNGSAPRSDVPPPSDNDASPF